MLEQLIEKNRSYRKFHEAEEVKPATFEGTGKPVNSRPVQTEYAE